MNKPQTEEYRLFETLTSRATDAYVCIAPDGSIYKCNPAFSQLTGLNKEDVIGRKWMDVVQLYDSPGGLQVRELGVQNSPSDLVSWSEPTDLYLMLKGEKSLSVEVTIAQISSTADNLQEWIMIVKDKSMHGQLESQMQRLSSLESLSLLTGGIAHDFNNLLTIVLGNVSKARLGLQESDSHPDQ